MRRAAVPLAAAVAALLGGCAAPAPSAYQSAESDALGGAVTVFAAASLTDAFGEIADAFEETNPGVDVILNFGGSSGLATQIVEGAPVDVFAAASPSTMATVVDAGLVRGKPADFATNVLQIAVAEGNPGGITGLADFADPQKTIALCAVEVPCGAAAASLLEGAGVTPSVDTFEQDVRAVLTKIELGEVDAGLVYVTDVRAASGGVEGIDVDSDPVGYPIATFVESRNPDAARVFADLVLGDRGQRILQDAGFGAP